MVMVLPALSVSTATEMTCPTIERPGTPVGSSVSTLTKPAEVDDPDCGAVHPFGIVTRSVPLSWTSAAVYVTAHSPDEPAATGADGEMIAVPVPGPAVVNATTPTARNAASTAIRMERWIVIGSC